MSLYTPALFARLQGVLGSSSGSGCNVTVTLRLRNVSEWLALP